MAEGHSYSDFVNVTLGVVDRQSKHIPPAIHGLPSEINPFWLVLPDQEVVYRTYTALFTLSTALQLVFQPFKINKPPGVHFPRISCSSVNPATHEFTTYTDFADKCFIYETFSVLSKFIPVKCIYVLLLFICINFFSWLLKAIWNRFHVVTRWRSKIFLTKTNNHHTTSFVYYKRKKLLERRGVLSDLKNERTPLFLPLIFFSPSALSYCKCNMNLRISRGFHNKSFFFHHRFSCT